jgi:hypothetical protein
MHLSKPARRWQGQIARCNTDFSTINQAVKIHFHLAEEYGPNHGQTMLLRMCILYKIND